MRASALASTVLPTPGTSSTSTWPSASRQRSGSRSVSVRRVHHRREARDDAIRQIGGGGRAAAPRARSIPPSAPLEQPLDLVEHRARDRGLRRVRHEPVAVGA